MITIRYIYSACVVVKTSDLTFLCDPWFTEGIYGGSWYQYPKLENPIEIIGDVDLIWISHLHPDHYDPHFLEAYFKRYGEKKILTARNKHFERMLKRDGFAFNAVDTHQVGTTILHLIPEDSGSEYDIDSALVIRRGDHCVVNTNDCVPNPEFLQRVKAIAGKVDILLAGYAGAGPWPQTYYETANKEGNRAAEKHEKLWLDRWLAWNKSLDPATSIPFAGKYWLGGKLINLNPYRGVPDAVVAGGTVLEDGGHAVIDTQTLLPSEERLEPYGWKEVRKSLVERRALFAYERIEVPQEFSFEKALSEAARNITKRYTGEPYTIEIRYGTERFGFSLLQPHGDPDWVIRIDPRLLYLLLTGKEHWNNAEVGSLYWSTREGPRNIEANKAMIFFTVRKAPENREKSSEAR